MIQVADAVGEIVDGGKNVTRFKTGERVIAQYATRWIDGEPQGDESAYLLGSTIPALWQNISYWIKRPWCTPQAI